MYNKFIFYPIAGYDKGFVLENSFKQNDDVYDIANYPILSIAMVKEKHKKPNIFKKYINKLLGKHNKICHSYLLIKLMDDVQLSLECIGNNIIMQKETIPYDVMRYCGGVERKKKYYCTKYHNIFYNYITLKELVDCILKYDFTNDFTNRVFNITTSTLYNF